MKKWTIHSTMSTRLTSNRKLGWRKMSRGWRTRGRGCGRIGEGRIFLLVGAIKKVKL